MSARHNIIAGLLALATPIEELRLDPGNARTGHAVERIAAVGELAPAILSPALIAAKELTRCTTSYVFVGSPNGLTTARTFNPLSRLVGLVIALLGAIEVLRFTYEALSAVFAVLWQSAAGLPMGMFRAAGLTSLTFVARLLCSAINAVGVFGLAMVSMLLAVAINAECAAVADLVSQFGILGPGLNMIRFQVDATFPAVLTYVVVALEDGRAPGFVLVATLFDTTAGFVASVEGMVWALLEVWCSAPRRGIRAVTDSFHKSLALFWIAPGQLGAFTSRGSIFSRSMTTSLATVLTAGHFVEVDVEWFPAVATG